jgi:hypothetical protein
VVCDLVSWLNLVEIFFGIITRQAIRRGAFGSVRELIEAITKFIDGWNERCGLSPGPRTPKGSLRKPTVNPLPARDTGVPGRKSSRYIQQELQRAFGACLAAVTP